MSKAGLVLRDVQTSQSSLEDIFVDLVKDSRMNWYAILAIYRFEMARTFRTIWQSIVSPVISTSLYFVVFGAAIGSRIAEVEGVSYGAFIVPGLIMLSVITQSIANASFGIYFPEIHRHDLRTAVGADQFHRDRHRLCRRGGDQGIHDRADHPGDRLSFRADAHRTPDLDANIPDADVSLVQPFRLHHRHLGAEFRAIATGSAADRHAAGVSRRLVLLDLDAAADCGRRSPCSTRWST